MKLFNVPHQETIVSSLESRVHVLPDEPDTFNQDTKALDNHVTAYQSLSVVCEQVSAESYSFIDKNNYVLYNEYIKAITSSLGVKSPPVVSQEAIQILPTVALNHHLSLEGFIGDMWEKIKGLFRRIYESVKKFFTSIFTRMGRIRSKLENLEKVLSSTDKDLKQLSVDKVPGGLASKYPFSGTLDQKVVTEVYTNVSSLTEVLGGVNKLATDLAKKEVLSKDFVAKVKSLRDLSKSATDKSKELEGSKEKGIKAMIPGTDKNKKNSEIKDTQKGLKEMADEATKDADKQEGEAIDIGKNNGDLDIDDAGFKAAKAEFGELLKQIETKFSSMKGKPLISGKVIKDIKVDEDSGIGVDMDTDKETPNILSMGSKMDLLKLVKASRETIKNTEEATKNYGQINDTIMDSLNTVDRLIKDLDGIGQEKLGKYKTVLSKKVRERLNLMKTFFNNYNTVNKELAGMVVEATEGNIEYAVQSMKYFG